MLAFGLLSEETNEANTWFFKEIKRARGQNKPLNFVTDDCREMKKGSCYYFK